MFYYSNSITKFDFMSKTLPDCSAKQSAIFHPRTLFQLRMSRNFFAAKYLQTVTGPIGHEKTVILQADICMSSTELQPMKEKKKMNCVEWYFYFFFRMVNKQQPSFGAEICSAFCQRTWQTVFQEQTYLNGRFYVNYPSNIFRSSRGFENWEYHSHILQFQLENIQSRDELTNRARSKMFDGL